MTLQDTILNWELGETSLNLEH